MLLQRFYHKKGGLLFIWTPPFGFDNCKSYCFFKTNQSGFRFLLDKFLYFLHLVSKLITSLV